MDARNGYFFAIFDNDVSYAEAAAKCQKVGATLPIIKNQPVKDAINYYDSEYLLSATIGSCKVSQHSWGCHTV